MRGSDEAAGGAGDGVVGGLAMAAGTLMAVGSRGNGGTSSKRSAMAGSDYRKKKMGMMQCYCARERVWRNRDETGRVGGHVGWGGGMTGWGLNEIMGRSGRYKGLAQEQKQVGKRR